MLNPGNRRRIPVTVSRTAPEESNRKVSRRENWVYHETYYRTRNRRGIGCTIGWRGRNVTVHIRRRKGEKRIEKGSGGGQDCGSNFRSKSYNWSIYSSVLTCLSFPPSCPRAVLFYSLRLLSLTCSVRLEEGAGRLSTLLLRNSITTTRSPRREPTFVVTLIVSSLLLVA